ncbi:RNA polymerase II elongation factor ELL [Liparis tanakae]|uniref:RNA polymerase II elongation factor ELL n=1 Tax=Liparis tanakae TaxID=230148 RepID=A0A4Z2G390_9TELE|nr:RNA polymerase II elongation factor ELL [Liparis tanakae]
MCLSLQGWSSGPTICFNGTKGIISVPRSENAAEMSVFHFGLSDVARDNPHGSFDCFQQYGSGSSEELSCLGVIQKKLTVNATDDSYDKARQSMAQAEEETRSRGAIVIKQGARLHGKKVRVRAPGPALAGLTKPRHPGRPRSLLAAAAAKRGVVDDAAIATKQKRAACASNGKSGVRERRLGERLAHLLALRPYTRPELILRLQRDGLTDAEKERLDAELLEVGQLTRDNTFLLKDVLFKELQRDWPGYTAGDQQLLKRIFIRRLCQPQHSLLTVPEAQVSPLRDTPDSSPKPPPPEEYTDPLASRKPRVSRLSGKARPAERAAGEGGKGESMDPRVLFDSLLTACRREEAEVAERLKAPPRCEEEPRVTESDPDRPPSPLAAPELSGHTLRRKKSKRKHRDQDQLRARKERRRDHSSEDPDIDVSLFCVEPSEILFESGVLKADDDAAEYLMKYAAISQPDQRQRYKRDFNTEYSEYRDLHARIDGVTRQFMELDAQLKRLHHDSLKYKTVRNQILQEYRKIKKSNPNYNQDRTRCEHLHNKLAHIKKLISEYDRQQL